MSRSPMTSPNSSPSTWTASSATATGWTTSKTVQRGFDELCTAVAAEVLSEESLGVREVIVAGEDGEDVMKSEGSQPQCAPLAS